MDIFNYLSKLATGYHTKSLKISGIPVTYKFYGKPIPFDPFSMLKELQFKFQDPNCLEVSLGHPFFHLFENELIVGGGLKPVVVAGFKLGGIRYQVNRAVVTVEKVRHSRYEFYGDGNILAVFQRSYDYGKSFEELVRSPLFSGSLPYGDTRLFRASHDSGQWMLGEVFGHSHLWLVTEPEQMEKMQQLLAVSIVPRDDKKHFK